MLLLPPKGSKNGTSLKEYLEEIERRSGKADKRLDEPELSPSELRVWNAFWTLHDGRPLTFTEMQAWSTLSHEKLTPWEAETLRMMSMTAIKEAQSG